MDKKKQTNSLDTFISGVVESNENRGKKICEYKNIPSLIELYKSMNAYKNTTNEQSMVIPSINTTGSRIQFSFNSTQISNIDEFVSCVKKYSPKSVITTSENKQIIVKIQINNSRRENRGK